MDFSRSSSCFWKKLSRFWMETREKKVHFQGKLKGTDLVFMARDTWWKYGMRCRLPRYLLWVFIAINITMRKGTLWQFPVRSDTPMLHIVPITPESVYRHFRQQNHQGIAPFRANRVPGNASRHGHQIADRHESYFFIMHYGWPGAVLIVRSDLDFYD